MPMMCPTHLISNRCMRFNTHYLAFQTRYGMPCTLSVVHYRWRLMEKTTFGWGNLIWLTWQEARDRQRLEQRYSTWEQALNMHYFFISVSHSWDPSVASVEINVSFLFQIQSHCTEI